jgi:WhiB family redox-sensing transcriptional regulator
VTSHRDPATHADPATHGPAVVATRVLEQAVRAGAGCRGRDPEDWYPGVSTSTYDVTDAHAQAERDHARTLCGGCPVTAACLELALRIPAGLHGIWGATTERDRRALLRRRHTGTDRAQLDLAGVG